MSERDEQRYPCLKCEAMLPENMFARRAAPGGTTRLDGWCLDCRGVSRPGRAGAAAPSPDQGGRVYRNAHHRAVAAAVRQLRSEHEQLYQRYRSEAQERSPLPPLRPGDPGRAPERMRVKALHARRAEQRLRADFPEEFEAYLRQALAGEGYPSAPGSGA